MLSMVTFHSRLQLDWKREEKICFAKALNVLSSVSLDSFSVCSLEQQSEMHKQSCLEKHTGSEQNNILEDFSPNILYEN